MSANLLIDLLEEQDLLSSEVIVELRRSVAQSKNRITPESLGKLLVDNGQLTRFQAIRLISQIKGGSPSSDTTPNKSDQTDEELGLLIDESAEETPEVVPVRNANRGVEAGDEIVEAVEVIEDVFGDEARPSSTRDSARPDEASSFSRRADSGFADSTSVLLKPVAIAAPKGNSWDAFRIWGVGFFLSVLLVALAWLVYWLMSGSASEFYARAQEAYEGRDYLKAAERFSSFATKFPSEDKATLAKVYAAIASIRQVSDQMGDPVEATKLAESLLPKIVNETGLSDDGVRSDLASVLVSIGEKTLQRADSAKTTDDRKAMIDMLDRHLILVRNPQYIPNAIRLTNEVRLKAMDEERARVLRDIQRAEDLVVAVDKMKAAIAKSDVDAAYQARREVTRRYPQLETDKRLLELQKQATDLQREAVKAATSSPTPVNIDSIKPIGPSVLLFKRAAAAKASDGAGSLDPEAVIFVKAKGSIYGLRAVDGTVLWRRYVGFENISDPIRLSNDARSDCLIVIPDRRVLARLSAQDGSSLWELDLGAKILQPTIDGQSIFVATNDGRVSSIDADSGQAKWSKQIPQKLPVGPAGSLNKPARYVVGEHSNIYVLGRNDGVCNEVYFLGHSSGTIAVPPVYSLGLLFVFENFEVGSSRIHIFKTNDQGTGIERCQDPIKMKGHIGIPPTVDGRRMVVMTDLGETQAFDFEPASDKNKLNRVAGLVANETKPRTSWPLVVGNELWIASNRFARYQIQVSAQKLVRDWVVEDEDQFVGRPSKIDDLVFHSRIVRGTEGVRVAATRAQSGQPVWETDLGVPIVGVQALDGGLAVINSQAALFAVAAASLGAGKPITARENPGRNQRTMQFESPTVLDGDRVAFLNPKHGNQIAVFDPKGKAGNLLQVNSLQISDGKPSGEGVPVGSGLLIPLDNGQLVFVDPLSGKQLSQPFQPTIEAGKKPRWVTPVVLADKETIVGATDQKTLYRLSVGSKIKELSQTKTERVWTQRLAVSPDGDLVCGVARGEAQDSAELHQGSDLARVAGVDLDGRVTWGPFASDKLFLVFSETGGLMAVDRSGKLLWKAGLGRVALVGRPLVDGADYLVAASNGTFFRVQATTGELKAKIAIGEPLSTSPTVMGSALLFAGAEGTLVAVPTAKTLTGTGDAP